MKKLLFTLLCCIFAGVTTAQITITDSAMSTGVRLHAHTPINTAFTNAGIALDDIYSFAIPIGFNFNFYGTNYTECVVSPNGTIVFNTTLAGAFANYVINAPLLGNSISYNSICMPWNDMDVSVDGTVYTAVEGVAPNRTFTVLYCGVSLFSCTTSHVLCSAVLHETTNAIDVYIANKPVCSGWNGGYSIEGVQNATGTNAVTVPGRDYPAVWTASNDAYRFTPVAGGTTYTVSSIPYTFSLPYTSSVTFKWYDSATGAYLGTGEAITVNPTVPTTYKAELSACGAEVSAAYIHSSPSCSGPSTAGTATSSTTTACASTPIHLSNAGYTAGANLQWQSSPDGVTWNNIAGAIMPSYTIPGVSSTTYYRCSATCPTAGTPAYTSPVNVTYTSTCPCLLTDAGSIVSSALYTCPTATVGLADVTYIAPMATLQWQSSADSTTWTDIPGATNNTYDITGATATLFYRLKFSCTTGSTMYTAGTKILFNAVCNCTGTPEAGTVTASPTYCDACTLTLNVSGYTLADSITFQWQRSDDSVTWTNLTGAMTPTVSLIPYGTYYYRCLVNCAASGTSAPTAGVKVSYHYSVLADSVAYPSPCVAPTFYLSLSGVSPTLSVITYFGDGTYDSSGTMPSGLTSYVSPSHTFLFADTYTIKQVVYDHNMPVDSVSYPFGYTYCNELPVVFYYDIDGDCVHSPYEPLNGIPVVVAVALNGVPLDTISATSGINYFTSTTIPGDVYSFEVLSPASIACSSGAVLYDTMPSVPGPLPALYAGLSCPAAGPDLTVYDVSIGAGPNRLRGDIYAANNSCTATGATVTLNYSMYYNHALYVTPMYTTLSGTSATWDLSGMLATGGIPTHISYDAWAPFISLAPLGAVVTTTTHIDPIAGDVNPANNDFVVIDTVKASCDPNSITAPLCIDKDSTWITYVLHFENTGNDTAHNIYVMDTLSYNLDMNSIRLLMASAAMNVAHVTDGGYNVLRFDFMNINLPDSSHHGLCDGAVIYKARVLNGTTPGTVIDNRAGIYFDVNSVVMTNTALTTIDCSRTEAVASITKDNEINIYPNPATGHIIVRTGKYNNTTATLRNIMGQCVQHIGISGTEQTLDIHELPAGLYSITVQGPGVTKTLKLVKE